MNPGAGSTRDWTCDTRCRIGQGCHHGYYGSMTPGTESGKGRQTGDCGCVNQAQGLGKGVKLETVDV